MFCFGFANENHNFKRKKSKFVSLCWALYLQKKGWTIISQECTNKCFCGPLLLLISIKRIKTSGIYRELVNNKDYVRKCNKIVSLQQNDC